MNYKMISRFISWILALEAIFMLPSFFISIANGEKAVAKSFLLTVCIAALMAGILHILSLRASKGFYAREGLICVGTSWIIMSAVGCLPFFLSGQIPSYIDALFEMVSGFTTTGASILSDIESLSRGLLFWRSFSHWLGGMGVLVFLLAVVPVGKSNTGFTMHLLRAESPGPDVGKLVPKIKQTAIILYSIYIIMTILNVAFLLFGKMPLFDALCTAFGTAGTGGFGIYNDSAASYSPYIQNVCTVFMLLFGINFSCYYLILLKQFKNVFKDEELRFYIGTVVLSVILITLNIRGLYSGLGETIRHAAFQVSSIITTTGFATADFNLWPSFSKAIIICLMIFGACAGSTGGGIKCARILIIAKTMVRNIRQILHPQKIQVIRINGRPMDEKLLANTNAYLAAYVIIIMTSFVLISFDGFSMTTNFTAVLSCFNNIGPGLDLVGPVSNYSLFSPLSKIVLIIDMLAGRLEIFPILVLMSRGTWKRS